MTSQCWPRKARSRPRSAATKLSCSAATLSPPTCSTNSTASFRKSWQRFSRRRTPRLPICAPSPTASSPTPAQMRLHHAGLKEDKTFVFIAAHLAAQFKAIGATNPIQTEVNQEELGPLTLTIQRQRGRRRYLPIGALNR